MSDQEAETIDTRETDETLVPSTPKSGAPGWLLPLSLVALSIAGGIGAGTLAQSTETGLSVGLGLFMSTAIFLALRKPPESRGRDDGGASISFGFNQGGTDKKNRQQRRAEEQKPHNRATRRAAKKAKRKGKKS
jgi:hypothetical protein